MGTLKQRELQDSAAGGPGSRILCIGDGTTAVVSVAVRKFKKSPNQQYAYLQFKVNDRTVTKYIGKVTAASKQDSIRMG